MKLMLPLVAAFAVLGLAHAGALRGNNNNARIPRNVAYYSGKNTGTPLTGVPVDQLPYDHLQLAFLMPSYNLWGGQTTGVNPAAIATGSVSV